MIPVKPAGRDSAETKNRALRRKLVAWFRANGRDLPWRRTRDPYAVMVSEFMCQQTTVAAVVPYFERWMARFPTVAALADADEQAVLGLWQGLGYYSRARNLQRAARAVVERHGGEIPADLAALEALPGVGNYTAAAVVAFAFDRPAAVVDANVARVLARLHDHAEPIDDARGKKFLLGAAGALQPAAGEAAEFNSALMELGALVCRPRAPLCLECPVRVECRARVPENLPVKRARVAVTSVTEHRGFFEDGGRLFLRQSTERWRGMWILPVAEAGGRPDHVENYPITRYRVRMEVRRLHPPVDPDLRGFTRAELAGLPIPSPHRRAIEALAGSAAKGHRRA